MILTRLRGLIPVLSVSDRRMLAIGALSMATILGIGKGLPALRRWEQAQRGAAEAARYKLAETESFIRTAMEARRRKVELSRRVSRLDSALITAASPAEAGAILVTMVTEAADSAHLRLATISVRSDSAFSGGFARLILRASVSGDVAGLMGFLTELERSESCLAVRELVLAQPEPAAPEHRPEALRFEIVVESLAFRAAVDPVKGP